ncbi:uncharacterized protein LOC142504356 [Primulina tabacum]|uniref:uncharacterized protein LOC142504356 n=1 Tax=Primulina tabacum TaxID=48773 RepID=UPI003F59557B
MLFTSPTENEPPTPTFVPETQLSDREFPIEVANMENVDSGAEGRKKRSTWRKVEDDVLARSFVTISDDPIIGNDQKAEAFWGRVASYYNENPSRSIYSAYHSGHSDEDILWLAYEKYREENNGIAFNLEHVWRIAKDRPMFTPQSVDHLVGTKKARTSESGVSNISSNQDASLYVDINEEENRPMGLKAAKRKGKGKTKSDIECMTTNLDNMFAKFTKYKSIKKAEVEMKQKQLEVEEMKAKAAIAKVQLKEYAILSKDTSQMTYGQFIIHERLCQEIRGRWNIQRDDAARRKGLSPLQKCTAAIRQLAYGVPADHLDEYLRMGESTAIKCLFKFCEHVVELFGVRYLRRPNADDV